MFLQIAIRYINNGKNMTICIARFFLNQLKGAVQAIIARQFPITYK